MGNFFIIRDLCEKQKITLRDLASRIGFTEGAIQKIISKGSTNTETLEKIAQVLEVPVGYFFEDTPGNITQTGNGNVGNVIGNSYRVMISDCENKLEIAEKENEHLRARLEEKERLLEEKERTIQILMKK